jgi:phage shock protein E
MTPDELLARLHSGPPVCVLDVRSEQEYRAGHVPGAINVPFLQIASRHQALASHRNETVVVYCGHGPRAYVAGSALRRRGFAHIEYLKGHMKKWRDLKLPVEVT